MKLSRQEVDQIRDAMEREGLDQIEVERDNGGVVKLYAVQLREFRKAVPLTKRAPRTPSGVPS